MTVLCLFDGIAGRTGGGWKREGIDKVPLFGRQEPWRERKVNPLLPNIVSLQQKFKQTS